jgi:hypothetical protein
MSQIRLQGKHGEKGNKGETEATTKVGECSKNPDQAGAPKVGIVRKQEITGVFLVEALIKVLDEYVMTSTLNTNESKIEIEEPIIEIEEVDLDQEVDQGCINYEDREVILDQLRLDHLNSEERNLLIETCLTYTDIFYLPVDRLISTNMTRHLVRLEAGVELVCTRQYRLPEGQKLEVKKQVEKLKSEGIIEESSSLWNSPLLVVVKKMDASRIQKFRLVVDYCKLSERTVGDTRCQILQKFWIS